MPYVSKAEQERARWMTLAEAVAHVQQCDECDADAALSQLRTALGDGQIVTRWEDQRPPRAIQGMIVNPDWPGQGREYWQSMEVRGSSVLDLVGRFRTLLLLRFSVLALWAAPPAPGASRAAGEGSNVIPITEAKEARLRGGRPSAKDEVFKALDELSQENHRVRGMDPTRLAELIAEHCGKTLSEKNWAQRTVLAHIQEWRFNQPD